MRWAVPVTGADRIVHMRAERLTACIAIEKRREHSRRKRRRNEERILLECGKDHRAQFAGGGRSLRQLHVVFGAATIDDRP